MSSLYITAKTEVDMEYTLDQIFMGITFEMTDNDDNEDGTRTARAEWQGHGEKGIAYRCEVLEEVVSYQII